MKKINLLLLLALPATSMAQYTGNTGRGDASILVSNTKLGMVLNVSITATNATCNGSSNGSATATASGGTTPYSYSWSASPSQTTQTATGLSAGQYFVTVTDANSATATDSITITEPPLIQNSATATICSGDSILINGIYRSVAGTYSDTLNTVNGCDSVITTTLNVNTNPSPTITAGGATTFCAGGSVTLTSSVALSYLWTGGATTASISATTSGSYFVTVTDGNGCTGASAATTVAVNPNVTAGTVSGTSPLCIGVTDTYSSNGTGGGTWTSTNTAVATVVAATGVVTAVSAGTADITYTVSSGCGSPVSALKTLTVNPVYSSTATASVCAGDSIQINGIYRSVAGTYSDTLNSVNSCDSVIATTLTVKNSNTGTDVQTACDSYAWINGVIYTASNNTATHTLTNAAGCDSVVTLNLTINNSNTGTDVKTACDSYAWIDGVIYTASNNTATHTLTNAAGCDSVVTLNLTINQTAIGGQQVTICSGDSILLQGSYQTTSGTYYDTLTSANGCDSIIETTLTIVQTTISISSTNVTCNGDIDGTATATASGGNTPYSYLWSNGATQSSVTGLPASVYFVTVTDNNFCSATDSVIISQPTVILTATATNSACNDATGSASVTASGGITPYAYQWSSGDVTPTADSLPSGIYIVSVTDANGCVAWTSATISDLNSPEITVTVTDVTCYNQNNGAINISVAAGVSPYTYSWSNGALVEDVGSLFAGPYQIIVTGANGCKAIQNITVQQPAALSIVMNVTNSLCASAVGAINAVVTGGTTPYFYNWIPGGQTTPSISNLQAGNYLMAVQDMNGCTKNAFAAVSAVDGPSVVIDSILAAGCGTEGSVYVSVSGGTTPYTFSWTTNGIIDTVGTTEDLIDVPAGNYGLNLTDNSGCVSAITATIQTTNTPVTPVCLVTVDTATLTNKVVWEENQSSGIVSYNIYRESTQSGVYFPVGNVPVLDVSVFTDSVANPITKAWRYKIAALDSCGNESPLSAAHQTIHLVPSVFGSNVSLTWSVYEGFSFGTYYIYRYASATGWQILDSLASNLHTYTDTSASGLSNLNYFIEAKHPNGCTATKSTVDYNSSRSNIKSIAAPGSIKELSLENALSIYPNPNDGTFTIELRTSVFGLPASISIYNVLGETVYQKPFTTYSAPVTLKQPAGIYNVQVVTEKGVMNKKLVVE